MYYVFMQHALYTLQYGPINKHSFVQLINIAFSTLFGILWYLSSSCYCPTYDFVRYAWEAFEKKTCAGGADLDFQFHLEIPFRNSGEKELGNKKQRPIH